MDNAGQKPIAQDDVLTGTQIRAARALLNWSGSDLARESRVSHQAIHRAEQTDGVPNMLIKNVIAIKTTLERNGVVFIDGAYSGDGGPGVRMRT